MLACVYRLDPSTRVTGALLPPRPRVTYLLTPTQATCCFAPERPTSHQPRPSLELHTSLRTSLRTSVHTEGEAVGRPVLVHASEVYAQGGVLAFWRGVLPTAVRGSMIGAVKMATYDKAKLLCETGGAAKGTVANFVGASVLTAMNTVLWTTPADFVRTLVMTGDGSQSMASLAAGAVRAHGPLALWKGWQGQLLRILPYGTLQAIFMEKIATALGSSMT